MNNLSTLLKKLSVIQMQFESLSKANETFNIFSVLHKDHDERRLHSRFLAALLNPNGSHKLNDKFLTTFLTITGLQDLDLNSAIVYPKESDKSENSNIDILIIDKKSKNAIVIENKIFAGDSNNETGGQLERYYNHVKTVEKIPSKNIHIFYLTLDGHEPSEESLGGKKSELSEKYHCLSYKVQILGWLNLCLEKTAATPFLRESILQYITLIKKMTNDTSIEERLAIKNLIAKSTENMISAKLLVENFNHVKWHTMREFWDELSIKLKELGYTIISSPTDKNISDTAHFFDYKKGFRNNNHYGIYFQPFNGLQLYIWNEYDFFLYWGCNKDSKTNSENKKIIKDFCSEKEDFNESETNVFWKYFQLSDDERIYFPDFSYEGTFNLIQSEYRNRIITKMVKEIKKFVDTIAKKQTKKI
jgi:hypothetical protein